MVNRDPLMIDTDAFLLDTMCMSAAEIGAYSLILFKYWFDAKAPPDDDVVLSRIARATKAQWRKVERAVRGKFDRRDGYLIHDWLERELKRKRFAMPFDWRERRAFVLNRDGEMCSYCGDARGPFEIDHVIPRSRGGSHSVDNLAVACRRCNRSKGALTAEEWEGLLGGANA